jgi:hypothetical protein
MYTGIILNIKLGSTFCVVNAQYDIIVLMLITLLNNHKIYMSYSDNAEACGRN